MEPLRGLPAQGAGYLAWRGNKSISFRAHKSLLKSTLQDMAAKNFEKKVVER
jgi:hypothetical protein